MQNYLVRLLEPKANGPEVAQILATLLNVKISGDTLNREIEEHPNYPSLLSVSDVLASYGIENIGIRFSLDKIANMPTPFITQLIGENNSTKFFTVVRETGNDMVCFFDSEKHQWRKLSQADFSKRCSGFALLCEAGDSPGEKDYNKKIKTERRKRTGLILAFSFLPILAIIMVAVSFVQNGINALLPSIYLLLTLIGSLIGVLLLLYELDRHNPLLKEICSTGAKINCGAVLQSKASRIAGISWSIIGFTYFTGILLLLLFSGITSKSILFTLSFVNIMAMPYTVFSVYYQWRIAKQWCVLCLGVQLLLVLQVITVFTGSWYTLMPFREINAELVIRTITAFVLPFLFTVRLVPALQKAKESKRINTELQKLKHNAQIFDALLQKQKVVADNPAGLGINLGNPDGMFKLIKVCNPYCQPCAAAHKPMEELLLNNPDVQIQILFTATNDEGDIKTPPVRHFLAIAEKNDEKTIKQALDDWYLADDKDYNLFAAKYPMYDDLKKQRDKIKEMHTWCAKTQIEFTPTFFVAMPNERAETIFYQLPRLYSVSDLKYFFSI